MERKEKTGVGYIFLPAIFSRTSVKTSKPSKLAIYRRVKILF